MPIAVIAIAAVLLAHGWPAGAYAFGPAGHRIAGVLAEGLLCTETAAQIDTLTGGEGLGALGLWADRIRGDEAWRHTGPWHYMNIGDEARLESYEHPPEGDVLWAIEHHAEQLASARSRGERAEALRFLVHFIVDIHQPLHVGRADDRGGNQVDVRFGDETVNLHRFWDTEVLQIGGLAEAEYAASLEPIAPMLAVSGGDDPPAVWAAESLALRAGVYAFRSRRGAAALLDEPYLRSADLVTRMRLAQAGVRLASTLDRLLGANEGC